MVGLPEEVGSVIARPDQAGFDRLSRIANRRQVFIERRSVCRGDRNETGVIPPRLFKVGEEECSVLDDPPAYASTVLRLRQWIFLYRQRVSCIESLITNEAIKPRMELVRPRLMPFGIRLNPR